MAAFYSLCAQSLGSPDRLALQIRRLRCGQSQERLAGAEKMDDDPIIIIFRPAIG
jgi:hypothetical protein